MSMVTPTEPTVVEKPRVAGSIGSGAVGVILIWAWGQVFPDNPLPPAVAAAIAGIATAAYGPAVRLFNRLVEPR